MNKYVFGIITSLLSEVKEFKKYDNLDKLKAILNNEIEGAQCKACIMNDSSIADAFYGIIVYPDIKLTSKDAQVSNVATYVIEIQRQTIDLLSPEELAAYIIHDISHNVLTTTVTERFKMAIYKACAMTETKVVEVVHNIDSKMFRLAVLDIANRTYKNTVIPDLDMYEPDRILVDMDICDYFNSALQKMNSIDYLDVTNIEDQNIFDIYTAEKMIKMIQEKVKGIEKTFNELTDYIEKIYDTKILSYYPTLETKITSDIYGMDVSGIERMKPLELKFLSESTIRNMCKDKEAVSTMILEAVNFEDRRGNVQASVLQKELDIINFKIDGISSNYERLSILDSIYDNIFALEKYIARHPDNSIANSYLQKFAKLTVILKDAKIAKKKYDVFVEYPNYGPNRNYEG